MAVKKLREADTPLILNSGYLETLERLNQQANGNALLRIWHIVGDKKRGIPALLPIGRASFYRGIKEGRYPAPVHHLGPSTSAWYYRDIMAVVMNEEATRTTKGGGNDTSN